MQTFDAIVLGLGGMGSAALYHLAKRGTRVLGLEQFPLVHARGSSHGQTRIIRTAYYEHPSYVPLVRRSFELWRELESLSGQQLLTPSPCLTVGPPGGELVTGVLRAAREHNLHIDHLNSAEIERDYPAFQIGPEYEGLVERDAGVLFVEKCVQAQLDAARLHGAMIRSETPVLNWSASDSGVSINTVSETFHAKKLVITAGAWANGLLSNIGVPLTVMRQTMHWFQPHNYLSFETVRFPIFLLDTPEGAFYGLPAVDARGVKIARHYGAPELTGPDDVNWTVGEDDERPVRAFLERYIPSAVGPTTGQVCMYTLTPDRHFVIDLHPHHPNVAVAAGFSGHGFKFSPVVGEFLAELVEWGKAKNELSLFETNRFQTTG